MSDDSYGPLHAAREKLCISQMLVPEYWREELGWALDIIDLVGSASCPDQWSRHDQPEYGASS